jgi:hypothetical protein
MDTIEHIRVWLGNYQTYIEKMTTYLSQFPDSAEAQQFMNTLYQIDPKFQVANITMHDLLNDASSLWMNFGQWY